MEAVRFTLAAERASTALDDIERMMEPLMEVLAIRADDLPVKARGQLARAQLAAADARVEADKEVAELRSFLMPADEPEEDGGDG